MIISRGLAAGLVLFGLVVPGEAFGSGDVTSAPLHVMTLNVRYGTALDGPDHWVFRRPRMIEVLKKRTPELLGLQEALFFQIDDLLAAFPQFKSIGVARDDGKMAGEYSAILYDTSRLQLLESDTFWLSDTPEVAGSNTWGAQCVRICTWAHFRDLKTGRNFYHFNTHLDHKSQPARAKSVRLILERVGKRKAGDPVLVTGDFNTSESNPATNLMRKGGFLDTFRVLHPDEKNVGTTNAFRPNTEVNKIDYIWVDSNWDVKAAEIVHDKVEGRWISDHLPVTAVLGL
jgi:endonuclease/exonuclease/phosphatase family metal-dependent hydrolase